MSGLKQELGLGQGVGLLSTSLLGTGVFAVPALAALVPAFLISLLIAQNEKQLPKDLQQK